MRGTNGRFKKGNPGGPGRPPRQTEREYLRATVQVCSLEDWGEVVRRAVEDAKGGDAKAREWLASYLLGNPEGSAPTLHRLAVEELAETDPVAKAAVFERMTNMAAR